jgi:hypothetical protein
MINITRQFLAIAILLFSTASYGGLITVAYNGSYDETAAPNGDYDALGGLSDVALFNLVEGANTFAGSVDRDSDGFSIGVGFGLRIISATIDWASNLPGILWPDFSTIPAGYLQQSQIGANAPSWTLQETNSVTPEIFTINQLQGTQVSTFFGSTVISGALFSTNPLSVEEGVYNNLLLGGGACAVGLVTNFPGISTSDCIEALDYTITYNVIRFANAPQQPNTGGPTTNVPAPATIWLLALGLVLVFRLAKRQS